MSGGKVQALESVRGLAALIVVVHHLAIAFAPAWTADPLKPPWLRVFHEGGFAVRVFFVLSGFVLSRSYLKTRRVDVLRSAAIRRYWRLAIPISASVALSYLLLAGGLYANQKVAAALSPGQADWLRALYGFDASLFSAAREALWRSLFAFVPLYSYNNVLWTMRTEFAGSLFVFAFLALTGGLRNRWLIYLAVVAAVCLLNILWLLDFVAGVGIGELFQFEPLRSAAEHGNWVLLPPILVFASLTLAGLTPAWLTEQTGFRFPLPGIINDFAAALLLVGVLLSRPLQRVLSWTPFVALGAMSFSLYLIHVPIECSLGCHVYLACAVDRGMTHEAAFAWTAAATLGASLFLGWVGSVTVEPWSIKVGQWIYTSIFQSTSPMTADRIC